MMLIAVVRPDDWDFPLFLHVLGAMLLVGALVVVVSTLLVGWRREDGGETLVLARLGFRTLLVAVLPAWLLMRIAGEWIASEEDFGDDEPGWVGVGYVTSEGGLVLLVIATVLAVAVWASVRADARGANGNPEHEAPHPDVPGASAEPEIADPMTAPVDAQDPLLDIHKGGDLSPLDEAERHRR